MHTEEFDIYFIADLHFNDETIIPYTGRSFTDIASMNAYIVDKWNSVVRDRDIVYVLGDLTGSDPSVAEIKSLVSQLKGKIILIRGNHDLLDDKTYLDMGIYKVYDHPVLYNDFFILSHEPQYISAKSPYVNIFGHVHDNPMYKTVSTHSRCVSAERLDYTPIEFDDILYDIKKVKEEQSLFTKGLVNIDDKENQ